MVKVSVIVPVYNVEKYIEKCLESLVNQTLQEIEIIVVNDGTKDKSEEIIKKYQDKYMQKIIYIKKQNGGLSDARNYGINKATGEYLAFVDSDDYIEKTMLEKMYNKAKQENADMVECDVSWIYTNKEKLDIGKNYQNQAEMFTDGRVMMCNKIFRTNLFEDVQFPKGLRYEDVEVFFELLPNINRTAYLNEVLYYYIQREDSIANYQTEKTKDMFIILQHILEYYKQKGIYETYKVELEYIYIRFLLGSSFLRMVKIKNKTIRKSLLKETWKLLNATFPNWKNNYILKSRKTKKDAYYRSVNKITFKIYSILFAII